MSRSMSSAEPDKMPSYAAFRLGLTVCRSSKVTQSHIFLKYMYIRFFTLVCITHCVRLENWNATNAALACGRYDIELENLAKKLSPTVWNLTV